MLFKLPSFVIMSWDNLLNINFYQVGVMAKRKVNKSQEIRDYVSANRTASAKDVVDALKKKGVKVSAPMVANVKSKAGLTRNGRGRPSSNGTSRSAKIGRTSPCTDVALEALIEAKRFVAKVGSAQEAVEVIRALEKLDSIAS